MSSSTSDPATSQINPQMQPKLDLDSGHAYQSDHNIASPTPPKIRFDQNVYPLVTPRRIWFLSVSLISFLLAYGSLMETEFYKSTIGGSSSNHARPLLFCVAAIGHTLWLIFLFYFSFCSSAYHRYRNHYLLKSLGELLVMLIVSVLILGIGHKHQELEIASTAASGSYFEPGHHYSLLEATATLTLHLGLVGTFYLGIFAVGFIFGILVIKNYLWRHIGHAEAPTNEHHQLTRDGVELV
ncbi:hypothetical protein L6164_033998 [Bauhinia variegata]|uniref:Uncharacterized protein n=1 Tax=Bauhinia variegata TaxID=167791 RepID=A0ACB9KTW4_BAUVA|nr:hypothetical protein L6164_033998 [Bauhinia variegata]